MSRRAPRALRLPAALLLVLSLGAAPTPAQATTIPADATDKTSETAWTISFPVPASLPYGYSPKKLAVGRSGANPAQVTWSGSFTNHPLRFDNLAIPGTSSGSSDIRPLKAGHYAYYCGIHGGAGGVGMSGEVWVAGPRAQVAASPEDVAPGGQTTLDAGGTDLVSFGGATASYEFDPEGDGTFLAATSSKTIQATYPTAGTYAAHVRVTDDAGRVDEASTWVYVAAPLPPPPPVDDSGPAPPAPSPTTPQTPARPSFDELTSLPSRKRCVSRRRGLRVVVHDTATADVRFARVKINGRPAKRLAVGKRREITVRGLRGRPDVSVSLWLADGSLVSRTYRYHVCRVRR